MSDMEKLSQLNSILLVMEDNKQKDMSILNDIKLNLQRKMEALQKLIIYKSEYMKANKDKPSQTVPALYANYEQFLRKLEQAITNQQISIESSEHNKIEVIQKIAIIDQKIQAIQIKIDEMTASINNQRETVESMAINELFSQNKQTEQT